MAGSSSKTNSAKSSAAAKKQPQLPDLSKFKPVLVFNNIARSFFMDLAVRFPDDDAIRRVNVLLDEIHDPESTVIIDAVDQAIGDRGLEVISRNDAIFSSIRPFNIDLSRLWASPQLTPETRKNVWEFLQLFVILINIHKLTKTYPGITDFLAKETGKLMADVRNGQPPSMDALFSKAMNVAVSFLGQGSLGSLAQLLGGGAQ